MGGSPIFIPHADACQYPPSISTVQHSSGFGASIDGVGRVVNVSRAWATTTRSPQRSPTRGSRKIQRGVGTLRSPGAPWQSRPPG